MHNSVKQGQFLGVADGCNHQNNIMYYKRLKRHYKQYSHHKTNANQQ